MDEKELRKCHKNLYSTNPIFGRRIREKAVGELSERAINNDHSVIPILVDAVFKPPDDVVKNLVLEALGQLKDPATINAFCAYWARTRNMELEKILCQSGYAAGTPLELRILTALKTGKIHLISGLGPEILPVLFNSVKDYDIDISRGAKTTLSYLTNEETIDAFCLKWWRTPDAMLEEILVKAHYVARYPPELKVKTALKVGKVDVLADVDRNTVKFLVNALSRGNSETVERIKEILSGIKKQDVIDDFCYYWAQKRSPILESIMGKCRYIAQKPPEIAILTKLKAGKIILLEDGEEEKLDIIAEALTDSDRGIAAAAERSLKEIKGSSLIDHFCKTWNMNLEPRMEKIIFEKSFMATKPPYLRVLTAAVAGKLEEIMRMKPATRQLIKNFYQLEEQKKGLLPLVEKIKENFALPLIKVCSHEDKAIAAKAGKQLISFTGRDLIDFFCFCWAITGNPLLGKLLRMAGYTASPDLMGLHLLTVLETGKTEYITNAGAEIIKPLLKIVREKETPFAEKAAAAFQYLKDARAIEAFCDIIILDRHPLLLKIAAAKNYAPADIYRKALFYFVTEQWGKYEKLDYQDTRPLLSLAFLQAPVAVKKVVSEVTDRCKKGNLLVNALIGKGTHLRIGELENTQWQIVVDSLKRNGRWEEMKKLVFLAPVKWGAEMVRVLCENKHVSSRDRDKDLRELCKILSESKNILFPDIFNMLTCREHHCHVDSLAINPTFGSFASGGMAEDTIRLWKFPEAKLLKTLGEKGKNSGKLVFTPDGKLLAAGNSGKNIHLWTFPGGRYFRALEGHDASVTCLAFSPNCSTLASGGPDKTLRLWNLPDGALINALPHDREITSLAFNPAGNMLAVGCRDGKIYVRDSGSGGIVFILEGYKNSVSTLSISPDGKILVGGSLDNSIRIWNMENGQIIKTLTAHNNWIMDSVITADGKFLISASLDKTIRFWSLPEGKLIRTIRLPGIGITCLAVSRDGKWLLSGGMDKAIRIWFLDWVKPSFFVDSDELPIVRQRLQNKALPEKRHNGLRFLERVLTGKFQQDLHKREKPISTGDFTIEFH